ncbi:MAG TPA: hypothetical protein PKD10_10330, partial [Paracoccaceae bacterium]|nr:hypothetical protein [Paracoccaceae bacterium]
CAGLPTGDRWRCEAQAQDACRKAASEQEKACMAEARACYASCGRMPQQRAHHWCIGRAGNVPVSFLCEGDVARPDSIAICTQRPEWRTVSTSLTCTGL